MIAPSFSALASWAPVIPVVLRADSRRSRSSPSDLPFAWERRIASRPLRSGGATSTRRPKRPGRSSALSSFSMWLEAATTITQLSSRSKPSSSTRSWLSACSRSLVPPSPPPSERWPPIASSSSMKITARFALRASLNRRRIRAAPRPANISTKPMPEDAAGRRGTELLVAVGVAQPVGDVHQLFLGGVDALDVLPVDHRGLAGLDELRLGGPQRALQQHDHHDQKRGHEDDAEDRV